ncbi:MAG: beta-ketoacyl synthase [Deltaproteobacteria bacterium]|nr:beta-ketoacyl synthase [Deltaproteobacteria bacterium]
MKKFEPIAIIGQGCALPGCFTPDELWNTLEAGQVNIMEAGPADWRISFDEIMLQPDDEDFLGRVCTGRGGYIRGFDKVFDARLYENETVPTDELDPLFKWCFYAAGQALKDGGYFDSKVRNRTGLILGNLSYPCKSYSRLYEEHHMAKCFPEWKTSSDIVNPVNRFMSGLPSVLTAQALGLGGAAFALDAACSSSLYAIKLACDELHSRRSDMMIAGGVNAADQLFLHVGFTALSALSPTGQTRPFNKDADGLIPAEGAAFVALKRLADAVRDGDSIAGVIRGIGLSNDGRSGGFLSPSRDGQIHCMNQAFEISGLSPRDVSFVECHATGTRVGDSIEIESMSRVFDDCQDLPVGSCKANIGHLITASGAAGLIKVLSSMKNERLLHTPGAYPLLGAMDGSPFRVPPTPEPWACDGRRVACVSNFGFGGNNAHLIVEQWSDEASYAVPVSKRARNDHEVAIVSLGVQTNRIADMPSFVEFVVNGTVNQEGLTDVLELSAEDLAFPPADLKQTLGQQLILLKVAAAALEQTSGLDCQRTGVFIGMGADAEINRYSLRWRLADLLREGSIEVGPKWMEEARKSIVPTLEAAAVVGTMPNIPANRLNSSYDYQGQSFTVSCEELSGDKALEIARQAISRGEIDAALVGAVDFSMEEIHEHAYREVTGGERTSADAAVVLVLKRHDLAQQDGDRVLAIIADEEAGTDYVQIDNSVSSSVTSKLGHAHACSGMLGIARAAVLASKNCITGPADDQPPRPALARATPACYRVATQSFFGPSAVTCLSSSPVNLECKAPRLHADELYTYGAADISSLLKLLADDTQSTEGPMRLAFVATDQTKEATRLRALELLETGLVREGANGHDLFFRAKEILGKVAFVYTGAASAYPGMGRELLGEFPMILDLLKPMLTNPAQCAEWIYEKDSPKARLPFYQLAGSSFLCQVHTVFTRQILGIQPEVAMGMSSGETNSIFASGVWDDMDGLFEDIAGSGMYDKNLGQDFETIRKYWGEPSDFEVDWVNQRLLAPALKVKALVENEERVYLTIINTPSDCVIGGDRQACERVVQALEGISAIPLGHDIAIHCPAVGPYEKKWRSLHTRKSKVVSGVALYSNYLDGPYRTTKSKVADALTGQAVQTVDFPRIVNRAFEDGVRVFVEHGPRNSLSQAIDVILKTKPHAAVSLDLAGKSSFRQALAASADLWCAGVPVDLESIRGRAEQKTSGPSLCFALRRPPIVLPDSDGRTASEVWKTPTHEPGIVRRMKPAPALANMEKTFVTATASVLPSESDSILPLSLLVEQHRNLLEVQKHYMAVQFDAQNDYHAFLQRAPVRFAGTVPSAQSIPTAPVSEKLPGPSFDREQLEVLCSGKVSSVFGKMFVRQDEYDIQVRMPEPPLLLCDRVLGIEGEPGALGLGTIWTETDVKADSWYLHNGRMPAGIFIESGQADLLLVSWLGVDFQNKGERAYRLLGCELTYHGHLPKPGETLEYDIHVDGYANQGDVMLFFFHYDCRINGELRISVRSGQAGFFTAEELADSGGVIWDAKDGKYARTPRLEIRANYTKKIRFTEDEVEAYTTGDMVSCFGPELRLTQTHTRTPRSHSGYQNFIQEVTTFDPHGGPMGRGYLCSTSKVTPDDWFFKGHFKNDPCMPGTLMAEACLQMMAFYMVGLGLTTDKDGWRFEPAPKTKYKFVCRGQCTPTSQQMVYEIFVDEVIKGPYPTLVAHVMCTVDGNKAFLCEQLALRLVPDWPRTSMTGLFDQAKVGLPVAGCDDFEFGYESLKNCAIGQPSLAFGDTYRHYDDIIRSPRLPGPPYLFVTRISQLNATMGVSSGEPTLAAEYDIPDDAWYFNENGFGTMPYCVLMEIALQPCGWLSTFTMRDDTKGKDLLFRNLDGNAVQHRDILPRQGQTITTAVKLTAASIMENVIIIKFDVECSLSGAPVFTMDTVFGFFSVDAMVDQKGLPISNDEASVHKLPGNVSIPLKEFPEKYFSESTACLPSSKLLMLDRVTGYWPDGGGVGLGHVRAEKDVRVNEWFFKAHFFQDPVQPGSLGVEAIIQLIQFYMLHTGMHEGMNNPRFEPICLGEKTTWIYRGQVTPDKMLVTVDIDIVEKGRDARGAFVIASSNYWVDGLKIYSAPRIGLRIVDNKATENTELKPATPVTDSYNSRTYELPELLQKYVDYDQIADSALKDFVEDWEKAQATRFVRNVVIEDLAEYSELKRGSAVYLANHQNFIEPCLLSLIVKWLGGSPMKIIGKQEHRDTWVGKLDRLGKALFGTYATVELLSFDRRSPMQFVELLNAFKADLGSQASSLLIHVEGARAIDAGHRIEKISSVLLDFTIDASLPIIPVRFVGGLPAENSRGRVDFTYGYGPQDYYLGRAIMPRMLASLNLKQRSRLVLDRINSLGEVVEQRGLIADDIDFAGKVKARMKNRNVSESSAVFIETLLERNERSEHTSAIIDKVNSTKKTLKDMAPDSAEKALLEFFSL